MTQSGLFGDDVDFPELAELERKKKEYDELIRTTGEQALTSTFTNFFNEDGQAISEFNWTQYTPYFMDGEPCEFWANTVDDWSHITNSTTEQRAVAREFLHKLAKKLSSMQDVLEHVYGDHVKVTVKQQDGRDGLALITTEDYSDHD